MATTTIAMNPAVSSSDVTVPFYTDDSISFEMLSSTGYSTLLSTGRPVATKLTINSTSGRLDYGTGTYYCLELPLDVVGENLDFGSIQNDALGRLRGWNYYSFGYTSSPTSYLNWYLCYYEGDFEYDSSSSLITEDSVVRIYFPSTAAYLSFCTGTYFAINYVNQAGNIITRNISYNGVASAYRKYTSVTKDRDWIAWTGTSSTTYPAYYNIRLAKSLDSQNSFTQATYTTYSVYMAKYGTSGVYLVNTTYQTACFPEGEYKWDDSVTWLYTFTSSRATTKLTNLVRTILNVNESAATELTTFKPWMIIPTCSEGTAALNLTEGGYYTPLEFSFTNGNLADVTLQSVTVTPFNLSSIGENLSKTWTYGTDYTTTLTASATTVVSLDCDTYFTDHVDTRYTVTFIFNVPEDYTVPKSGTATTYTVGHLAKREDNPTDGTVTFRGMRLSW